MESNKQKNPNIFKSDCCGHEKYIISLNTEISIQNKEYALKIKDLENQVEEREDENGSLEKTISNMKGLVKNFYEMNKHYKEVLNKTNSISSDTKLFMRQHTNKVKQYLIFYYCFFSLFSAIYYEYYTFDSFYITYLTVFLQIYIVSFQQYYLYGLNFPIFKNKQERIKELTTNIKKIDQAQDYIYDFIDQQ
jgi:hypothetical protein